MTAMTDFDRSLALWLETAGPVHIDVRVVEGALAVARRSGQRRGVMSFLTGPGAWPRRRRIELAAMRPAVRLAIAVGLVMALIAGSLWVGGRLLEKPKPPPGYRGVFVVASTLPDGNVVGQITPLPDGRAWIRVGAPGFDPGPALIWDPATRQFTQTAAAAPRRASGPIVLPDGRFLFFDYPDWSKPPPRVQTADVYDPQSGRSTPVHDLDASRGSIPIRLADGRVLLAGGSEPDSETFRPIRNAQIFDPASKTFAATGSLNIPRASSLTLLLDGRVFVFGGDVSGSDETEIANPELFDPRAGTFQVIDAPPLIPPDTTGRKYPVGAHAMPILLADGRVLIPGVGCAEVHDIVDGYSATYWPASALIFDPHTAKFTSGGTLPHCVSRAALLPTGEVLVTGWWYADGPGQTSWAGLLDPVTGRTRELASPGTSGPYYSLIPLSSGRILLVNDDRTLRLFE